MAKLQYGKFDDSLVRSAVIELFETHFNTQLDETPPEMKLIDLTGSTITNLGVEVEHGKWKGNFWENDNYSLASGLEFRTVNIPMRKQKYWKDEYMFYGKQYDNPSSEKNLFVRTNIDFTQIIIIRPETIRNEETVTVTKFQPNNSNQLEEWLSFKRENVETYNLIEGKLILEKNES